MNLQTLTSIVGPINRGQLESGFAAEAEADSTVQKWRGGACSRAIGTRRVAKPPIVEDLSHLSTGCGGRKPFHVVPLEEIIRRCRPDLRAVYMSIYGRGETPSTLAKKIGVHPLTVPATIGGRRGMKMQARLSVVLTKQELKLLGWKTK